MDQLSPYTEETLQYKLDVTCKHILDIQEALEDDDEICEAICQLQDEFNAASDGIRDCGRKSYPDPLEAFPPEVWQQIILDTALAPPFVLTSVSITWLQKITGNPLFWTDIRLSRMEVDNAAKVITCLELSKECPISLGIDYTYEEWVEIAPLVLPHILRVADLGLYGLNAMETLNSMPLLPHLHVLSGSIFNYADHLSEKFKALEAINHGRMPQLQRVPAAMLCPPATSPWLKTAEYIFIMDKMTSEEQVDILTQAPRLQHLDIVESERAYWPGSSKIRPSLPSLRSLSYYGPNVIPTLGFVGRSLTRLQLGFTYLGALGDVLRRVQHSPLSQLTLTYHVSEDTVSPDSSERPPAVVQEKLSIPGIKSLSITYPESKTEPGYDSWVQSMHLIVGHALVGLEELSLSKVLLTSQVQHYIESLPDLQELSLQQCIADEAGLFGLRTPRSLQRVYCSYVNISLPINFTGSANLEDLMATLLFRRRDKPRDGGENVLPLISCDSHSHKESNIGLSLANSDSLLSSYDLEFIGAVYDDEDSSTIIEGLLEISMSRPRDFPGLKRLAFGRWPLEWDLLIMMLERRNLRLQSGVSRITEMELRPKPPEHLRRILLALLAGRYPARTSLESYSLDAVGRRMFDPESSGCYKCCFLLRDCDAMHQPPKDPAEGFPSFHEYLQKLALDHALPHELIVAEPPFTKRDAKWLAGLKERRRDFWEGYLKSLSTLSRVESCSEWDSWLNLNASEYFDDGA